MSLLIPEIVLCGFIVLLLGLTLGNQLSAKTLSGLALTAAALLVGGSVYALGSAGTLFGGTYRVDLFSQLFKIVLSLGFLWTICLSDDFFGRVGDKALEYLFFLSSSLLGMMMLVSAEEILTLYISLELSSYSLYILSSLRNDRKSSEASVKYLVFGAAASGLMLYGLSLVVGVSGSSDIGTIANNLTALGSIPAFIVGLALVLVALLFKLSNFPMHFWAPDVYENSWLPVTNFIATASKAAAVAVLIRVLLWLGLSPAVILIMGLLSFVSMTLGNCVALVQQDVRRLLAYSSIAQAGYILLGLSSATQAGYSSSIFYAVAYVIMNTGAFVVLNEVARATGKDNPTLSDFNGLAERNGFLALLLLLSLLSLAGIPPLVGFTGKWILFSAAMDQGHWFLVLWAVINSVISLFYYLVVVKHAYLEKPIVSTPIRLSMKVNVLGWALFGALILAGFFPDPLIRLSQAAINNAGLF